MYVAAFQTAKTYAVTGSLGAGLRAGLFSLAAPGGANFSNAALNFIADGVSGGIFSVLQGGKFGHGFISSAVGNHMAGAGGSNPYMRIAVSAIVGGTISSVTGGKFVNGAASAAFATALREYREGNILAKACSRCGTVSVGELGGQSYEQLEALRDGLYDARADGYDRETINTGLHKIYGQMEKVRPKNVFSKESIIMGGLNARYKQSQHNTAVFQGYMLGTASIGVYGMGGVLTAAGHYGNASALYNIGRGQAQLSDYVAIATWGYGTAMNHVAPTMKNFNAIKTDVVGCVTGGQGITCPTRW